MRKIVIGFFITASSLVASTLSSTKNNNQAYITGHVGTGVNSIYLVSSIDDRTCEVGLYPCGIIAKPGFTLPTPFGPISYSDLNNPDKVIIISTQSEY